MAVRLTTIEGGKARRPSLTACPRCGRPHEPARSWRERAADRLVDAALVSCWFAFGALPVAVIHALDRTAPGLWGLVPLVYVVGGLGGMMLGLAVRTRRVALRRLAERSTGRAA